MTEPRDPPERYQVSYSGRVRSELRALLLRAIAAGHGKDALAAARKFNEALEWYPQVGEPLRDLSMPGQTLYVDVVAPLTVRYIIDEPRRMVFVVSPFKVLPRAGFA